MIGCGPNCTGGCNGQAGMGQFDPISAVSSVIGGVFGFEGAKVNADTAKMQARNQMKLAKQQAQSALTDLQYQAAIQAQQDAVDQSQSIRNTEIIALIAIGGAAVVISAIFLYGATKKK
jgi:hypothetical protein